MSTTSADLRGLERASCGWATRAFRRAGGGTQNTCGERMEGHRLTSFVPEQRGQRGGVRRCPSDPHSRSSHPVLDQLKLMFMRSSIAVGRSDVLLILTVNLTERPYWGVNLTGVCLRI